MNRKPRKLKVQPDYIQSHEALLGLLPEGLAIPLHEALSRSRANESETEAGFVAWLVGWCSQYAKLRMIDAAGNVHFEVSGKGAASRTLFVAHTDTVAWQAGQNDYYLYRGSLKVTSQVLGADDGAGCALLCYMMSKGVPGRYIFTREEESGGHGSAHLVTCYPELLRRYDRAIAFDRKGQSEVIYQQGGSECASMAAAEALSDALNDQGMLYMPSNKGSFTDTKLYRRLIPECFNVSVGYENEHGSKELLDLKHLAELAAAVIEIDWDSLPVKRDPTKAELKRVTAPKAAANKVWESAFSEAKYEDDLFPQAGSVSNEAKYSKSVHDHLAAFEKGRKSGLEDFLCVELYPQDTSLARMMLKFDRITDDVIEQAFLYESFQATEYLLDTIMVEMVH